MTSYARHHGQKLRTPRIALALVMAFVALASLPAQNALADTASALARLISAYPDQHLQRDGDALVWPDGTRMAGDDGRGSKPFEAWLAAPDLEDMLKAAYPAHTELSAPPKDSDPGRARNEPFFDKMYGDCRKNEVTPHLVTIPWLPKKHGGTLQFTSVNGAAARLAEISNELDALPRAFDKYLMPIGGTYNCRVIAGTNRRSAHSHGIAIDIATKHTSYWQWAEAKSGNSGTVTWTNEIPREIVDIFERHGFIWGGRWYHYDTMHFEYRPELFAPPSEAAAAPASAAQTRAPADTPPNGPAPSSEGPPAAPSRGHQGDPKGPAR